MIQFTKRPLVALGVLGAVGTLAPAACNAQNDRAQPVAGIGGPRTWAAQADGFASVDALGQKGTTGGQGGQTVTVDNLGDLEKYAAAPEPYIILIKGTIVKEPFGKSINVSSNKTLLGLGDDATILHGELHLNSVSNVIIRNLTIKDSWVPDDPNGKKFDFDAIQIDNSHHIWIDHCNLTHMEDGLIDLRKKSDYVTVSWCILSHHNKAFGIGWYPETGSLHVTIHHTWIHDTTQRNPSLDNGTGHLYNNYLENIGSYGNYSRGKSKLVVENSYFEKVHNPLICAPEAEMVSKGNIIKDSATDDAAQGKIKGAAFDPHQFYNYTLDPADTVPALLEKYAGPQAAVGVAPGKVPEAALPRWEANAQVKPAAQITVAADGSGDYKTIQDAIAAVPDKSETRTIIRIKPGTYQGQIMVPASKTNVSFIGDDVQKTVLTYAYNTNEENPPGIEQRYKGTTVVVLADGFQARDITFQNASGDHGQALALRIDGDRAIVTDCRLLGWQDTLMLNKGRQYFTNDYIEGRVDFIYGSGTALFEKCEIKSKNGGHITAASTPQEKPYGFVFRDCDLTEDPQPWIDPATGQPPAGRKVGALADLGRPWRPYGSVTYLNCRMGSHILPAGWNNWGKPENEQTARYAEYGSVTPDGKPVDVSKRAAWAKVLTADEAAVYTTDKVLDGWAPAPEIAAMPPRSTDKRG
jgi:pectinesterase